MGQERRREEGKGKKHPKAGVESARVPACPHRYPEQRWGLERWGGQAAAGLPSPREVRPLRVTEPGQIPHLSNSKAPALGQRAHVGLGVTLPILPPRPGPRLLGCRIGDNP